MSGLGYNPRTDKTDKLSGAVKKGLVGVMRGVGTLFGINPFTHSGMYGMLDYQHKEQKRKEAGLLQGKSQGRVIPKKMTETEAIRMGQLEASGRRPVFSQEHFKKGGRRSMNKNKKGKVKTLPHHDIS
jgi:hypothetical protein|tara:strand:+ start:205 stop:588 length:384 start_codon:yes stop_codon:yes gene_type:complete